LKLRFNNTVLEAYEALYQAQVLADETNQNVVVYNWSPGQHKHDSVYLIQVPCGVVVDTPMAEMYGG